MGKVLFTPQAKKFQDDAKHIAPTDKVKEGDVIWTK